VLAAVFVIMALFLGTRPTSNSSGGSPSSTGSEVDDEMEAVSGPTNSADIRD
jgi:hypothetical protein